jgi:hypothetical protein
VTTPETKSAPNALGCKLHFEFALLGTESVVSSNSGLMSYSSAENGKKAQNARPDSEACFIGSFGTMPGVEKKADQTFLWRNGARQNSNNTSMVGHRIGDYPSTIITLPTVPKLPLPEVPKAPASAYRVDSVPSDCGSGDYIVANSKLSDLKDLDGLVRVFLQQVKITKGPALEISGIVNNVPRDMERPGRANVTFAGKPQALQIFYDGDGIIKFNDNTKFIGIIYAPRARVELGRCEVRGAIIARDIVSEGLTAVYFDRELLKINEW